LNLIDYTGVNMRLKTAILKRITYSRKIVIVSIVGIIAVMLVPSMLTGCANKNGASMLETRQLVIPSELEPKAVLPNFGGELFYECNYEVGEQIGKEFNTGTVVCISKLKDFVEG
jgi:hypothetical protein